MTDQYCFPSPPVLRFTPEVLSGQLAATALAAGIVSIPSSVQPSEVELAILAHELLQFAPDLARQLMEAGMTKLALV